MISPDTAYLLLVDTEDSGGQRQPPGTGTQVLVAVCTDMINAQGSRQGIMPSTHVAGEAERRQGLASSGKTAGQRWVPVYPSGDLEGFQKKNWR